MSPQREKINFEPNIPIAVTLEFDGGKEVPARNGVQYLYWVDGQRSMFLDPPAHEQIQAAGLKAGDSLEITKTLKGRAINWEVVHIVDQPADAGWPPAPPPPPVRSQPRTSPHSAAPPVPQQPAAAAPTASQPTGTLSKCTLDLVSCFSAAIDALQEAQAYAKRKGLDLRFDSGDVRSLAISVYIGKQKGGC